jgi:uncharacterized membrane protein
MAFCPSCGASVEGRFCPKCGTAMGGAAPAGAAPGAATGAATGMTDNMASALCYVLGLVTGILFLVLAPYNQNKTVRFHAFQSIFMHVSLIGIYIVLGFLVRMMLGFLGVMIFPLIGLAAFVLWVYLIISAYQGKTVVLPVIGDLAKQQA